MLMPETLALALTNLTSPPVLAFALGLIAASFKANLKLPKSIYQALSIFLLLAIGIKGGVALRSSHIGELAWPIVLAVAVGLIVPALAFAILRFITKLSPVDRGSIAAHYGSTSLVTFTAALVFIDSAAIPADGYLATLLAIMEIPGIIVGLYLAQRSLPHSPSTKSILHEVLLGRSVLLLAGGVAIGAITGASGYVAVEPFFGGLFAGVLTLFLLEMGTQAGRSLSSAKTMSFGIVGFAIAFPLIIGSLTTPLALFIGMSPGSAALFGVLSASASYIAAPAAVKLSIPQANTGLSLTMSLGITFPVNLLVGIPLFVAIANALG
jgi:hypothetical protein